MNWQDNLSCATPLYPQYTSSNIQLMRMEQAYIVAVYLKAERRKSQSAYRDASRVVFATLLCVNTAYSG